MGFGVLVVVGLLVVVVVVGEVCSVAGKGVGGWHGCLFSSWMGTSSVLLRGQRRGSFAIEHSTFQQRSKSEKSAATNQSTCFVHQLHLASLTYTQTTATSVFQKKLRHDYRRASAEQKAPTNCGCLMASSDEHRGWGFLRGCCVERSNRAKRH